MKRHLLTLSIVITIVLISCEKNEPPMRLNIDSELLFAGTLDAKTWESFSGTVALSIDKGYYVCGTNRPYGHGAGKLDVNDTTINFIDTVSSLIPLLYGPTYVLSGEHYYEYDGESLKLWRDQNIGNIEYNLKIKKE